MREPEDKQDEKLIADVKCYGWHVLKVLETEDGPGFAFSIGLFHSYSHAEILIMGLPLDWMHQMINGIAGKIKEGNRFIDGEKYPRILDGYDCAFRSVDKRFYKDYLGYALWFYEHRDFPALQCVWPDKQSKFPWDDAFDDALIIRQPVLHGGRV